MQGTMLWFNDAKGYGLIRTEEDERLRVAGSGFLPGHAPEPRCKGQAVVFDRELGDDPYAVNVAFVAREEPRRARLRAARGGQKL
ncbi:MAG TPA: hypothetical protein VFJ77_11275 [Gaiellaceae bacterium]|nr:hypothetical protein [Gaiellaceae bacterium]